MKEITRRLYTKPVMLGMAFLVGMALVVALFFTTRARRRQTRFSCGRERQIRDSSDGETFHDFASAPIPANFFGAGSHAYAQHVPSKACLWGQGATLTQSSSGTNLSRCRAAAHRSR